MSFETALRSRIKALPAILAASAPVEWNDRKGYPGVVLTLVSLPVQRHMAGQNAARPGRVQIDVMAQDKPAVVALREALIAMAAVGDVVGGVRFGPAQNLTVTDLSEQPDTDKFIFRDMIEATLWHIVET